MFLIARCCVVTTNDLVEQSMSFLTYPPKKRKVKKQNRVHSDKIASSLCGEMAEWSNAPDSKSGIRLVRIEGSNPSLSAIFFALKHNVKDIFAFDNS